MTTDNENMSNETTSEDTNREEVSHESGENTTEDQPETFPREYVEKLRNEAAQYRTRAKRADEYAERLHVALVDATGRLADPTDLPFNPDHLEDTEALTEAIDALLERKPHLASRTPYGDVGQGIRSTTADVDLAALLRARA
ncbi:hypothetical protein MHY20_00105 [Helcobacillus sp. ACRRO]|uniref:hypothetical protein n=1 Tax=Helcobacillus sp. ACRRO TaxID=2918202 RepID=UPI001EF481C0|nr:hypothetical protein [Helcobacillus sp. ACRRO]MCG7426033.1 hypothetical protein [Helcobacillus sp. ACRRO]